MQAITAWEQHLRQTLMTRPFQTNIVAISRTLLAIAGLSTLLFNNLHTLFYSGLTDGATLLDSPQSFPNLYALLGAEKLWLARIIAVIILMAAAIGIYPRYTALLQWWVTYSYVTAGVEVDGGDQIAGILTLLLIPVCLADNRRWHWHTHKINYPAYARIFLHFCFLLIAIQVAIIYFHAAVAKMGVREWTDGTATYYWFTNPQFGLSAWLKPFFMPLLENPYTLTAITWGSMALETFLFAAIFMKRSYRIQLMRLGIAFHFFIFLVHGLFSFFLIMTAALILYLYPQQESLSWRKLFSLKTYWPDSLGKTAG
jgi:antimicrobial peptide system SdpB family protein